MKATSPPQYPAEQYVKYRPVPPEALFSLIYSKLNHLELAWDCGCGNGQAAVELAKRFKRVVATDVSETQIQQAVKRENIDYHVAPAENTKIMNNSIDLITISQALHWFDHIAFEKEVKRVLKNRGVIAAWAYGYPQINGRVDELIVGLSRGPLDNYWEKGRDYLENQYRDIPFPFEYERYDEFFSEKKFNFSDVMGWLSSWSSYLKYLKDTGDDILKTIKPDMLAAWGDPAAVKTVKFPIYLLVGKNSK